MSKITDFDVMNAAFETSGEELLKRSTQTTADGYVLGYCETGIDPFYGRYYLYGVTVNFRDEFKIQYRLFIYRYVYKDCYRQGVRGYVEQSETNNHEFLCYVYDGECPIADAKKETICRGQARLNRLGKT